MFSFFPGVVCILPTFVIIGAMKSGTTSLLHYLSLHPSVSVSDPKELNFFITEGSWEKGIDWYSSQFKDRPSRGEASTSYSKYPLYDGVPKRMYSVIPEVRLLYLIREPISRIESHIQQSRCQELDDRSLSEIFQTMDNHYVNCSMYWKQLTRYLVFYPPENILVIRTDELQNRREHVMKKVFSFIGVDAKFQSTGFSRVLHSSESKKRKNVFGRSLSRLKPGRMIRGLIPTPINSMFRRATMEPVHRPGLTPEIVGNVMNHLHQDLQELSEFTGIDFSDWEGIPRNSH